VKKIMLLVLGVVLLIALSPAVVFAGPPSPPDFGNYNPLDLPGPPESWGVEKIIPPLSAPGGSVHIITDPLEATGIDPDATGWVTFWCQSKIGFHYHIGASGLDPLSRYSVRAFGIQAIVVPPGTPGAIDTGEGFWILIVGSLDLDLGAFKTDANGLGTVRGIEKLANGFYGLVVEVTDAGGDIVLDSSADDQGFLVY
jgi:hypothetical protein